MASKPDAGSPDGTQGGTAVPAESKVKGSAAQDQPRTVAELAGESASSPLGPLTAVINIKCPDQTGVVSEPDDTVLLGRRVSYLQLRTE